MMKIAVIVPCRNESHYISQFLNNFEKLEKGQHEVHLVISDGLSDDGTWQILEEYRKKNSNVHILTNKAKIVSNGLNIAITQVEADLYIRLDVHTLYDSRYLLNCVARHESNPEFTCVGGPWVAVGSTPLTKAISHAFSSKFINGYSRNKDSRYSGAVDSVYLGSWKGDCFKIFGFFDEDLVRNQDDEHNMRIWSKGGIVYQDRAIRSQYVPREDLKKLFRQFWQYGFWRAVVGKKYGRVQSVRQIIPIVGLIYLFLSIVYSLLRGLNIFVLIPALSYGFVLLACACELFYKNRSVRSAIYVPIVVVVMHASYALGCFWGIICARKDKKTIREGSSLDTTR